MREALEQARQGRLHILGEIVKTMDKPREDYKPHAPRMISFEVPTDVIGAIIGPGGKLFRKYKSQQIPLLPLKKWVVKGM